MATTTAERLAEARTAYHQMMIGQARVELWFDGRRTVFTPADAPRLERYIKSLEEALAIETGQRLPPRRRRIVFGGG